MDKGIIYQNGKSLVAVQKVLTEASNAIREKGRSIQGSDIPEVLGAVVGSAAGVGVGMAAVSAAGTAGLSAVGISSGLAAMGSVVGGGMAVGIFVAGAPMVALSVGGYAVLSARNKRRLLQTKEALYQDALRKHDAIIQELDGKVELSAQRMEYLKSLNILLHEIIQNLEKDLDK